MPDFCCPEIVSGTLDFCHGEEQWKAIEVWNGVKRNWPNLQAECLWIKEVGIEIESVDSRGVKDVALQVDMFGKILASTCSIFWDVVSPRSDVSLILCRICFCPCLNTRVMSRHPNLPVEVTLIDERTRRMHDAPLLFRRDLASLEKLHF